MNETTSRRLSVGLLWHSARSGNLGVGALTLGNMAIAREVAEKAGFEPHFTLLSMRDGDTDPIVGDDVAVRTINTKSILSPSGYASWVKKLDCVLDIGAGDSFAEIYGPKRFGFMWLSKALTIAQHVPLVLSPQTIGPFTKTPYRQLAASVMNRSYVVVSRDDKSLAVAKEMAPKANNIIAVDVAFVLPYVSQTHLRGGPKLRVGINASGLLMEEAITGRNHFGLSYDYAAFTRQLIRSLLDRGDVEVHLVPHATSKTMPQDDDNRYADMLAAEFPGVIRVPEFPGPSEAKSYISGLDFLVAGRMHACVGAYSSGTPVIPIAYSRKFDGLFGMLGYKWLTPVKGLDVDGAVNFVLEGLDKRAELAADLAEGMKTVQQRLDVYRGALHNLFMEIKAKSA
jgi:colanic acid/amylovoran biosynthesis protein